MTTSLLGVKDADLKRVLRSMAAEIDSLNTRLSSVVSEEGTFIGNLGVNTVMSTSEGDLGVTAGAIAVLNDTDDITEGSTNLYLTGAGDADDLAESANRKFVGSGGGGTMDLIGEGTSFKRAEANSVDSSGRIIKLRRTAADLSPNDISRRDEVQDNIGGLGNSDVRDGTTLVIDVDNREYELGTILDAVTVGSSPDGETADRVRAGAVRGLNAIDTDGFTIVGNLEEGTSGASNGVSTYGVTVTDGVSIDADSGTGGGDGTGEGGTPEP